MLPGDRVYVRLPADTFDRWVTHLPATLVELTRQDASVRLQNGLLITVKRRQVFTRAEFRRHLLSVVK